MIVPISLELMLDYHLTLLDSDNRLMNDEPWHGWEYMWTTHFDEWALIQSFYLGVESEAIIHLPSRKLLIIENNDAYRAVKEKMKQAGNRIVTREELWELMGRDPADLP
jgi:hypothetical protein